MSDVARRRVAALLLIAGIAIAVLAIADIGPFEDPPTVEEEVQAAVEEFFGAASRGDAAGFCRRLTEDARSTLRSQVASLLGEDEAPGCEKAFDLLRDSLEGAELTVRYVSVSGNRARVEARSKLAGRIAEPRTIELLEEDGEWKISDPG